MTIQEATKKLRIALIQRKISRGLYPDKVKEELEKHKGVQDIILSISKREATIKKFN